MRRVYLIVAFIPFGFSYCKDSSKNLPTTNAINTTSDSNNLHIIVDTIDHTTYPEIYSFLKSLIKSHDLDSSFGLILEPETFCDLSQTDIAYLKKNLLLEKNRKLQTIAKTDTTRLTDSILNVSYELPPIINASTLQTRYLTYSDINFMVRNKPDPKVFRWDNSRLGFNMKNKEKYYNLSIPMFSRNHKIAVILIEELCPGLCGTGMTYVYRKNSQKWIHSSTGMFWVH